MRDDQFEHNLQVALIAYASAIPITPESLARARAVALAPRAAVQWWRRIATPPVQRMPLVLAVLALAAIAATIIAGAAIRNLERPRIGEIAVSWDGNVEVVNPVTRTRRIVVKCSLAGSGCANLDYGLAWSPDGRRLAYTLTRFMSGAVAEPPDSELGLWILDVDSGAARRVIGCDKSACERPLSVAWSPDGSRIAMSAAGAPRLEMVDLADGTSVTLDLGVSVDSVGWSPDGTRLIFAALEGAYTSAADGTDVAPLFHERGADFLHPAWSPDGARVAYLAYTPAVQEPAGGRLGHIWITNADGSGATALFNATESCCRGAASWGGPVWSPDGIKVAFVAGNDNHLYVMATTGGTAMDLGSAVGRTSPAWQPVR